LRKKATDLAMNTRFAYDDTVLLRFGLENHRSVLERVELSMVAVDRHRPAARPLPGRSERVLTTAVLFGPNASGKTNVLRGLVWLAAAVGESLRFWEQSVPREPCRFGDGPTRPSTFEVELLVDGVHSAYRLVVDDQRVLEEALAVYPLRRRRVLFERTRDEVRFRRGLGELAAGIRPLLRRTSLVLSAVLQLPEPAAGTEAAAVVGVARALQGFTYRVPRRLPVPAGFPPEGIVVLDPPWVPTAQLLGLETEEKPQFRQAVVGFLTAADLGVADATVVEHAPPRDGLRWWQTRHPVLVHQVEGRTVELDLLEESSGTQTWFSLVGPVLQALRSGAVVLLDELDASLHPDLSARLVQLFQDRRTNPAGAQLLCTAHDPSLLRSLNRDEVWFTERTPQGTTSLVALSDFGGDQVRRSTDLERAYLRGRFGAQPLLDDPRFEEVLAQLRESPALVGPR
jgi:hypothetical protein